MKVSFSNVWVIVFFIESTDEIFKRRYKTSISILNTTALLQIHSKNEQPVRSCWKQLWNSIGEPELARTQV